jgi:DNA-binding CsgD family transcriptional regulator
MWQNAVIENVRTAETPSAILQCLWDGLKTLGVVSASYHFTPALSSQVGKFMVLDQFGHSAEWLELYNNPEFRAIDPIPDFVMRAAAPCTWKQILAMVEPSPEVATYEEACKTYNIITEEKDGISLPLYGPMSRDAYFSASFGRNFTPADSVRIYEILAVAQFAHISIIQRQRRDFETEVSLSRRERDVLQWVAHGKSVTDIATILGVSSATVDTYLRRIYAKLQVNDKVSAVLAALTNGLITY